jgi:hypothetical protein
VPTLLAAALAAEAAGVLKARYRTAATDDRNLTPAQKVN